jgi:hypothetical protein
MDLKRSDINKMVGKIGEKIYNKTIGCLLRYHSI